MPMIALSQVRMAWAILAMGMLCPVALRAADAAGTELFSNPDFAPATHDPSWPDDWRRKPGIAYQADKESHYLRFTAPQPPGDVGLWRDLVIPPGVKAMQLTVRYRTHDLKIGAGKNAGAGASVTIFDAVRIKFSPGPAPLVFSKSATDWTDTSIKFPVPDGAVSLILNLGLTDVEAGTLDVAEISLRSISPSDIPATAPVAASDAVSIRREGTHTIIGEGKPTVWFIHPYVDVVGHDFDMGITNLVSEAREQGHPVAVGVAESLDSVNTANEANTTYVFTYKNINYPLPEKAHRLVFFNTWLKSSVTWPASRDGKKDVIMIGSKTLHNNGDGLATDKDRWWQIQKEDPGLSLTVLDSTGYYLPISVWRTALLKIILEDSSQ